MNNITAYELSIDTHGLSFLCAFGTHINGGWCAILNFGASCELAAFPNSTGENADKIAYALENCPADERKWLPKNSAAVSEIAMELSKTITKYIAESRCSDV